MRMPVIIAGDFNFLPSEFSKTEWPSRLQVTILKPNISTTLKGFEGRILDFLLVSSDILNLVQDLAVQVATPWKHVGLSTSIAVAPLGRHCFNTQATPGVAHHRI